MLIGKGGSFMKPVLSVAVLKYLLLLVLLVLLAGCGSGGSGAAPSASAETGSLSARLVWPEATVAAVTKAAAPAGVVTIRLIVSGPGMTTIQQDFPATGAGGTITDIPVGSNRTLTVQGLDASGTVIYQAVVTGITISSGQTANLGSVAMQVIVVPAVPVNFSALAVSNSRIDLAWTAGDQLATGFVIERKTGTGGSWTQIATPTANGQRHQLQRHRPGPCHQLLLPDTGNQPRR